MFTPSVRPMLAALLALSACSTGPEHLDGRDDVFTLRLGEAEAQGVLALLNDPATTVDILDHDAALYANAARNLIAHRQGPDGVDGTADDNLFDDLAEVDSVPYVGNKMLQRLVDYSFFAGYSFQFAIGIYEGYLVSYGEAATVLNTVNNGSVDTLDAMLDVRAVNEIIARRPIPSMDVLDTVMYIGPVGMGNLLDSQLGAQPEDSCTLNSNCDAGYVCETYLPGLNECRPATSLTGVGDTCASDLDCGDALRCVAEQAPGYGGQGYCDAAWFSKTWTDVGILPLPDVACFTQEVLSMASVPVEVLLAVDVKHPSADSLILRATDPAGTEVTLPYSPGVMAIPNSGDDLVNGMWQFRLENTDIPGVELIPCDSFGLPPLGGSEEPMFPGLDGEQDELDGLEGGPGAGPELPEDPSFTPEQYGFIDGWALHISSRWD